MPNRLPVTLAINDYDHVRDLASGVVPVEGVALNCMHHPVEEIQEGIRNGVRKVNIDTDIRIAMTGAMRRAMATDRGEFDPRKVFKEATAAARGLYTYNPATVPLATTVGEP